LRTETLFLAYNFDKKSFEARHPTLRHHGCLDTVCEHFCICGRICFQAP